LSPQLDIKGARICCRGRGYVSVVTKQGPDGTSPPVNMLGIEICWGSPFMIAGIRKKFDLQAGGKRNKQEDKKQSIHEVVYLDDTALRLPWDILIGSSTCLSCCWKWRMEVR
jgi:hypothetical protein